MPVPADARCRQHLDAHRIRSDGEISHLHCSGSGLHPHPRGKVRIHPAAVHTSLPPSTCLLWKGDGVGFARSACRPVVHPVVTAPVNKGGQGEIKRNGKIKAMRRERDAGSKDPHTGATLSQSGNHDRPPFETRSDEKCRCLFGALCGFFSKAGGKEARWQIGCRPVCSPPRSKGPSLPKPCDPDSREDGSTVAAIGSADHIQNTDVVWACRVWLTTHDQKPHLI
ncbi:uncharacterized protein B0H64DRAFT_179330 [Chaetomium fimeti]|uniref:Uncharacterized protein n=1 Tax=Chaetomium fimeti TaxID=1854472 RepID=A0AAE0LQZ4_9PEZI|nr:hypothetical protein B0H64DRAFT_179330 [Chaetomium fimeti]